MQVATIRSGKHETNVVESCARPKWLPIAGQLLIPTASPVSSTHRSIFAPVLAIAAASIAPSAAFAREVVATEAQRGQTLRLHPGDRLRLALPSNGTTGFTWTVKAMPPHLRLLANRVEAPVVPPGLVGAAGRQILMIEARRPGSGVLRLRYRQPWKGGMAGDVFILRIESGRIPLARRRS